MTLPQCLGVRWDYATASLIFGQIAFVPVDVRSLLYKVNRRLARFNDSFGKFALGSTAMRGSRAGGVDATNVAGILGETDKEQVGQDADREPPKTVACDV